MTWFLRKSFGGHGPVRLNVSKTGLGVSIGVKGFRLGTGPKGQYVHAGRYGVYYRKQLGNTRTGVYPWVTEHTRVLNVPGLAGAPAWQSSLDGGSPEHQATAAAIHSRVRRLATGQFWGLILFAASFPVGVVGALLGMYVNPSLAMTAVLGTPLFWGGIIWAFAARKKLHDARRTTRLEYTLDDWTRREQDRTSAAVGALGTSQVLRIVQSVGHETDARRAKAAALRFDNAPAYAGVYHGGFLEAAQPIPRIASADAEYYLAPDGVYTIAGNRRRVAIYSYIGLQARTESFEWLEEQAAPNDAEFVRYQWRFPNKDGSRDLRYNNNHQIPVFRYTLIRLQHPEGLDLAIQASNGPVAESFAQEVNRRAEGLQEAANRPARRVLTCPRCKERVDVSSSSKPRCPSCGFGSSGPRPQQAG